MVKSHRKSLKDKYLSLFLSLSLLSVCLMGRGQQYHAGAHVVTNDAIGPAQATPVDARTMFYDSLLFLYRPFQSSSEAISYFPNATNRFGNYILVIDSGGTLLGNGKYLNGHNTFYMWADTTSNAGLVKLSLFGTSGACSGCLIAGNNLSDVANAGTSRTNLGLGSIAVLGSTAGGDLSGTWPNPTVAKFNGQLPSYYLNYGNLTNPPPAVSLTTTGSSGVATYNSGTGVLNIPNYSGGGSSCLNCNADSINQIPANLSNTRNNYIVVLDTVNNQLILLPPDTVYRTPGKDSIQIMINGRYYSILDSIGAAGSGLTNLNGLTASTQFFAVGTSGSDFNINSSGSTHTFNLPSASASTRGALTSADWNTFNNKINLTSLSASSPLLYNGGTGVFSIQQASTSQAGYLNAADWNTFNGKQTTLINGNGTIVQTNHINLGGKLVDNIYWNGSAGKKFQFDTADIYLNNPVTGITIYNGDSSSPANSVVINPTSVNINDALGSSVLMSGEIFEMQNSSATTSHSRGFFIINGLLTEESSIGSGGVQLQTDSINIIGRGTSGLPGPHIGFASYDSLSGFIYADTIGFQVGNYTSRSIGDYLGLIDPASGRMGWFTPGGGGGSGTVTSFSAGSLSPLFTTSVATSTTTPALSFTLSTATAHGILGNNTGSTAAPTYFVPTSTTLNTWFGGTIQSAITLTTTGSSGAATFSGGTLNIPQYSGGGSFISNAGSGYRLVNYNAQTIRSLSCTGCTLDTATTGQIGITVTGGGSPDTVYVQPRGVSGFQIGYASGTDTISLKKLVQGTNVTLTQNADSSITISASGGTDSAVVNGFGIGQTISGTTKYISFDSTAGGGFHTAPYNNVHYLPYATFANGSVIFSNGTALAQDNSEFYFDNINFRLGIGKPNPSFLLDLAASGSSTNSVPAIVLSSTAGSAFGPTQYFNDVSSGGHNIQLLNNGSSDAHLGLFTFYDVTTANSTADVQLAHIMSFDMHQRIGLKGIVAPSAYLTIAADSSVTGYSAVKWLQGAINTNIEIGAMHSNTGLLMFDSSNTVRDTLATRSWARNNISGGGGGGSFVALDGVQNYTSGSTVTVSNGDNYLYVNPSSVVSALTITLPTTWHNSNNVFIVFGGTITSANPVVTSLTVVGGSGQTLVQVTNPNGGTFNAGEVIEYHINGTFDYRIL